MGAMQGLDSVSTKLGTTTTAMQSAVPAGLALAGAATAVGGAFFGAISDAASFEAQMSGIKAVMTPEEIVLFGDALGDLALALGRETVYTADQAANAIEELIKQGVLVTDVLGDKGAAAAALSLAAATGTSVTNAATVAATALNAFKIPADQLGSPGGVVDTLAGVVNTTAASMDSLRLGLSDVGAVANLTGLSFEDTALAIGVLNQNGLTANTAGTALKTMLLNLQPETDKQAKLFAQLGIITADGSNAFFDATGKVRDLAGISDVLQGALEGMTQQQKMATLEMMFGTQGMQAAAIMAGYTGEQIQELTGRVQGISAADAAKTRLDNLNGAMEQLGGSASSLSITVGTIFLPVLTTAAQGLTFLLNAFQSLPEPVQMVVVAVVGITGVIAGLVAAFVLLGPMFTAVAAGFGAIAVAASPVLIPILAIGAAAAALYLAWQTNFGGIRDVAAEVWAAIQPALVNIQNAVSALGDALGPAFAGASSAVQPLVDALSTLANQYLSQLPDLVRDVGDAFNTVGDILRAVWDVLTVGDLASLGNLFAVAGDDAAGFANVLLWVRDTAQSLWAIVQMLITGDFQGGIFGLQEDHPFIGFLLAAREYGQALWDMFQTLLGGFGALGALLSGDEATWNAWVAQLEMASERVFEALWNMWGFIGEFLAGLPGFIAEKGPDIWAGFVTLAWELTTRIAEALGHLLSYIGDVLGTLIPSLITLLPDPWEPFVLGAWNLGVRIAEAIGNVLAFIGQAIGAIPALIEGAGDLFGPFILSAWNIGTRIAEAFANVLAFIVEATTFIPRLILGAGDIWGPLVDSAWAIGGRIAEAFGNFMTFIGESLAGIPALIEGLGDLFGGIVTAIWNLGEPIGNALGHIFGFIGEMIAGIPDMIAGMGDIFGGIVNAAGELYGRIAGAIEPIKQLLADTFGAFWNWLTGAITIGGGGGGGGEQPAPGTGDSGALAMLQASLGPLTAVMIGMATVFEALRVSLETNTIVLTAVAQGVTAGGAAPPPSGPVVSVGTLIISSESEAQDFLNLVAEAVLASARRVTPPVSGATALV